MGTLLILALLIPKQLKLAGNWLNKACYIPSIGYFADAKMHQEAPYLPTVQKFQVIPEYFRG